MKGRGKGRGGGGGGARGGNQAKPGGGRASGAKSQPSKNQSQATSSSSSSPQKTFALDEECRTLLSTLRKGLGDLVPALPVLISSDNPLPPSNLPVQLSTSTNETATSSSASSSTSTASRLSTAQAKAALAGSAQTLANATTKFTVAWKSVVEGMSSEGARDVKPFCDSLVEAAQQLVLTGAFLASANGRCWSPLLVDSVRQTIAFTLESVDRLIAAFIEMEETGPVPKGKRKGGNNKNLDDNADGEGLTARLTGQVWDRCKALERLPLDNASVVNNEVEKWMATIQDAIKELGDLKLADPKDDKDDEEKDDDTKAKGKANEGEKEDDEVDDDDWDDEDWDDEDEDEGLSEEEMRPVPGCLLLLKASYGILNGMRPFLKEVEQAADTQSVNGELEEDVRWFEEIMKEAKLASGEVDEVVVSVYPPQKLDALKTAARSLRERVVRIVALLRGHKRLKTIERANKMLSLVEMMLGRADEVLAYLISAE